jgi:L-lysine 6-transaminase
MSIDPKKVKEILGKNILADGFDPVIDLNKSHGSWIVDQRDGTEYLDMFAMFASGSVGYNHPYILKHKDKLGEIAINKTTLSDIYNIYYAEFVETFNEIAIPNYLKNAFFIDGGSLAVENALKAAFDWKRRMNLSKGSKINGDKVIYFNQAFHGRTGYTLTLTNTADPRKTMYFPEFPWFKVDNPYITFPLSSDILTDLVKKENAVLESIKEIVKNNKDDVAALILEPIQGEGGDNHFRDEFIVQLKNICDNNDIILIFDEVQTGIGLTGKMWAHEHFSVKPDIISFGKKTQVCGMLAGDKIYNLEDNVFKESSRINSTFGGNLVDMYRFKLILEIIDNESLLDNTNKMGNYLLDCITSLSEKFPGYVTNPRGKGLFCAFNMPSGIERDKLINTLLDKHIMILGSGLRSIRFRPHLNVLKEDLDICINAIHDSIKEMLN